MEALQAKYAATPKMPEPHADIGEWWALYDYGMDTVRKWPKGFKPDYPEERRRKHHVTEKAVFKAGAYTRPLLSST